MGEEREWKKIVWMNIALLHLWDAITILNSFHSLRKHDYSWHIMESSVTVTMKDDRNALPAQLIRLQRFIWCRRKGREWEVSSHGESSLSSSSFFREWAFTSPKFFFVSSFKSPIRIQVGSDEALLARYSLLNYLNFHSSEWEVWYWDLVLLIQSVEHEILNPMVMGSSAT